MDTTFLTGLYTLAVVAVTELAKRVKAKDYLGAGTILFCGAVGGAASATVGLSAKFGMDP